MRGDSSNYGQEYLQAVGSSQNLTLIVSERTEGEYYCHSITEGYDLLTSPAASILLRRRPRLTSPETQVGQPGELVRVVCSAISAPQPTGVSWTYLGRTIQPGTDLILGALSQTGNGLIITENTKYEVVTSMEGYTFESTLIIRESTTEDFGYYGCAITNSLGSVEASIYLEKQGILLSVDFSNIFKIVVKLS